MILPFASQSQQNISQLVTQKKAYNQIYKNSVVRLVMSPYCGRNHSSPFRHSPSS